MLEVGFVGWRGMVGSVLMDRMQTENDFDKINAAFFSTSQAGAVIPQIAGKANQMVKDAYDLAELSKRDCIVTTQGSDYTREILPKLRQTGWDGYWLDAASLLRMEDDSIIILDPINRKNIDIALSDGIKNFIGGNCTVSLLLMALDGLFKADLVEWVSSMTYQAASGAGANNIRELLQQNGVIYTAVSDLLKDKTANILDINEKVSQTLHAADFPKEHFGAPLAGNVLPWIDSGLENGQTKEEWKGGVESNKILGYAPDTIKVDGICVRVGALRSHSQALTIKLKRKDISVAEISEIIAKANPWVYVVANNKFDTFHKLTPAFVSGSLNVGVGRIRKLKFGEDYLGLFTVGDQLLWGAAEPLRRMLNILAGKL